MAWKRLQFVRDLIHTISGSTRTDLRACVICSSFLCFLRWQYQLRRYSTTIATPAQVAISTRFRFVSLSDERLMSPKFFWSVFFISPSAAAVWELAEPPIILDTRMEFWKLVHQSNFSMWILKVLELEVRYNSDTVFFRRNVKNVERGPKPCRKMQKMSTYWAKA